MSDERFSIKPQDDYWAVVDNYNDDKVCIINGIHTKIEAIWLCDFMNEQQSTIEQLQEENEELKHWKKRIIEYLTDWFNKTEYLSVLYKINEIRIEIGLDSDE